MRVNRFCICGSDLRLYCGLVPDTQIGTTFGHEFTGVVEEVGPSVQTLKVGNQELVPFNVFCGFCHFCQRELYSNCHDVNAQSSCARAARCRSSAFMARPSMRSRSATRATKG